MTKPFQLQPVKKFRRIRVQACANCKYLASIDGIDFRCRRPLRTRNGKQPVWRFTAWNDPFADTWQHVCDRWVKQST